ncbi:MAG TPA: hypothetical protein VLU43_07890 [Anaeromyxobacteraceae bacterium]|nr:hypothetical protein [Anaeromyxobacteraceae bacterium]
MLATLAAFQLLALGQAKLADPAESPPSTAEAPAQAPQAPAKEGAAPPPARAKAAAPALPSLLSAEPLGGASVGLAWVGWTTLGAAWGQGLSPRDDLGAFGDFDWTTTEMRLGGWYRRPIGKAGDFHLAGRLALSWYLDFGTHWAREGNHGDRGLQIAPALIASTRGAGGVFTITGDLPLTVTFWHSGGLLFQPRLSVAYETALYDELTVGVRAGLGARAGAGGAPIPTAQGTFEFLVLAGYRF